jgi:hypothetical protein
MRDLVSIICIAPLLAACSQGVAGGSSGSGQDVFLQFSDPSFTRTEASESVVFRVELDTAHEEDIQIAFSWSGDATYSADYGVPSKGLVTVPAGDINTTIFVNVFEDDLGELDEVLELRLEKPDNAFLGPRTTTHLYIIDDDSVAVEEVEPNDSPLEANDVGHLAEGIAFEITGQMVPALLDWFEVTGTGTGAKTYLYARLDPASPTAYVVLNLADANGAPIEFQQSKGPGSAVEIQYDLAPGETVFLGVESSAEVTSYILDVVGL